MTLSEIFAKHDISAVWHFTDRANVPLIQEHGGLLSLRELEQRSIRVPRPGGNEWSQDADRRRELDRYVHLAFVQNHPMLYIAEKEGRIKDPVWLKIDASVLTNSGVCFCSTVSNKNGARILNHEEAAEDVDFEILFTRTDWGVRELHERRKAAEKAEILVPNMITCDKILEYVNGEKTGVHTSPWP
jgi:hypothetical protein